MRLSNVIEMLWKRNRDAILQVEDLQTQVDTCRKRTKELEKEASDSNATLGRLESELAIAYDQLRAARRFV